MPERKGNREGTERAGGNQEVTAGTPKSQEEEKKKEVLHSGADIPKGTAACGE